MPKKIGGQTDFQKGGNRLHRKLSAHHVSSGHGNVSGKNSCKTVGIIPGQT
jgi:hypothetical protein